MDDYQDLLRISVATAGNDHRLGANEAPPAVVSVFLGDELAAILGCIEHDAPYTSIDTGKVRLGVDVLVDMDQLLCLPEPFTPTKGFS